MLLTGKPKRKVVGNPVGRFIYSEKRCKYYGRYLQNNKQYKWSCLYRTEHKSYLYNAFRKYGLKKFTFEIVEECDTGLLNEKEIYYIKLYKSNNKNFGYNLNNGGNNYIGEDNGRSLLTEDDVISIRTLRSQFKTKDEVYDKYKDIISKSGFEDIWQGRRWPHIFVDGAYSKEVRTFQQKLRGGRGHKCLISDEEVIKIRNRYVREQMKDIYEDYKEIYSSLRSFAFVVHGRSYSHLPIYKKRENFWINK